MKLEGSLDAFSLPDIFQLLSFTRKTGGLHLANLAARADGVVFFASGQVTGASADCSRQPLARRLVGSGAVEDEALAAAVKAASAGEAAGVVRALLDAGAVDPDLVGRAAQEQTVDAIFDLLRWQEGDFAFVMDEANPDDVGVAVTVEAVLADAEACQASWESVVSVVPSSSTVLAMPVVLGGDPAVSRDEWALLSLVDGRRTVAELVDLTGSGQYAVVSTLAGLVTRGLLELRAPEAADDHVAVVTRRQQLLAPLESFTPTATQGAAPGAAPVVAAAASGPAPSPAARPATPAATPPAPQEAELVGSGQPSAPVMLGGAHVPQDVVPPRPEPFLPRRQADFDDHADHPVAAERPTPSPSTHPGNLGEVMGTAATAPALDGTAVIERDPSVNRSLMLRLIAGVRGL